MLDLLGSRRLHFLLTALLRIAASASPVSGKQLAETLHCPRRYLEPDLQAMASAGILESRRGAGGGYRMAMSPHRISLSDILHCIASGTAGMIN
ncbi:MAG: Rrf2 family transcriptional regulator, partial [Mariprofundaceae bacterium]|nr:Rrf2 family transcriptional regulator [Mariprofundaceae bacterium]